jgi:hypothetical protein
LRACGHGFGFRETASTTGSALPLGLAAFAAFGLVLKVLIVEEVLLSRRKYEICPAIDALEDSILEFRHNVIRCHLNLE